MEAQRIDDGHNDGTTTPTIKGVLDSRSGATRERQHANGGESRKRQPDPTDERSQDCDSAWSRANGDQGVSKFRTKRGTLTLEIKASVWDKTGGLCWYCGKMLHPFREFTIDHIQPSSHGGSDDVQNLVPSCRHCNGKKGGQSSEAIRQMFRRRPPQFPEDKTSFSMSEAAEVLGVSQATVGRLRSAYRVGRMDGKSVVFSGFEILVMEQGRKR